MTLEYPNWVANDTVGTRKDTATLLVGTAKENDLLVRHHVRSTQGGFYISDALADLVYDDSADNPAEQSDSLAEQSEQPEKPAKKKAESEKKTSTKKTSGNRAAKNTGTAKEQDSA